MEKGCAKRFWENNERLYAIFVSFERERIVSCIEGDNDRIFGVWGKRGRIV
jgi:hypothetical protein